MQAALMRAVPTDELDVADVPRPAVEADDDLIVRVDACGICGTDLHILEGSSYRPELPFVLGHEPVGLVVDAGQTGSQWVGRRVAITLFTGCGACAMCQRGDERLCPDLRSITGVLKAWGGYAEYMRVHAQQALDVPGSLTSPEAAALVDCGATAANAVRQALERAPRSVLVVGAGPIGFLSAELLRRQAIPTVVVHRSPARRQVLERLGYDVVGSLEEVVHAPDIVLDCAGVPEVAAAALAVLAPKGAYILAGYARVPELDLAVAARKELAILGVRSGSRNDLETVMAAAADRTIRLPEIFPWPLGQINEALDALRARKVAGKAVILPASGH